MQPLHTLALREAPKGPAVDPPASPEDEAFHLPLCRLWDQSVLIDYEDAEDCLHFRWHMRYGWKYSRKQRGFSRVPFVYTYVTMPNGKVHKLHLQHMVLKVSPRTKVSFRGKDLFDFRKANLIIQLPLKEPSPS